MQLHEKILIAHNGEYQKVDTIKEELIEKFSPSLTDTKSILTTDQQYLYQNIISGRPYSLLVLIDSVNLKVVKKILKRLPYRLPTILITDKPLQGPKIKQLIEPVHSINAWEVTTG